MSNFFTIDQRELGSFGSELGTVHVFEQTRRRPRRRGEATDVHEVRCWAVLEGEGEGPQLPTMTAFFAVRGEEPSQREVLERVRALLVVTDRLEEVERRNRPRLPRGYTFSSTSVSCFGVGCEGAYVLTDDMEIAHFDEHETLGGFFAGVARVNTSCPTCGHLAILEVPVKKLEDMERSEKERGL